MGGIPLSPALSVPVREPNRRRARNARAARTMPRDLLLSPACPVQRATLPLTLKRNHAQQTPTPATRSVS
jgi:hypothetical protein